MARIMRHGVWIEIETGKEARRLQKIRQMEAEENALSERDQRMLEALNSNNLGAVKAILDEFDPNAKGNK